MVFFRDEFTDCFISFNHCGWGGPWYKCEDTTGYYPKKGAQNVTWEHVWAQVHKDFDFTISSPGHLYMIFESHEGVTIGTTKKGKDGKWQGVSVSGGVRSAIYYGTELRNIPEPVRYKINPNGSIEFDRFQPGHGPIHVGPDQWLKPGQFRVTLVAGRPYNYNTGICTYVPGSGNVKVLFIPDIPEVIDSDKDGVPDDKDKCLGTPAGTEVDEKGCPKGGEFTWSTIGPDSSFIIEPGTDLKYSHPPVDILSVDVIGGSEVTYEKYTEMIKAGVAPEEVWRVMQEDERLALVMESDMYVFEDYFLGVCLKGLEGAAWAGRRANFILGCGTGGGWCVQLSARCILRLRRQAYPSGR